MARAEIRPVRPGDVEALAAIMRAEDAAEVRAGGHEPLEALEKSVRASRVANALVLGGELAGLFGLVDCYAESALGFGYGRPWLLTGPAVARAPVAFMRASRLVLDQFLREYPVLQNLIDARYDAALRWAWHTGAEIGDPVAVQPSGLPFHPVVWRSPWATH